MTAPDEQKRLDTVHNERQKITATYVNGLGFALFAVGGVAPIIGSLNHLGPVGIGSIVVPAVCFASSGALHWFARRVLGGLK